MNIILYFNILESIYYYIITFIEFFYFYIFNKGSSKNLKYEDTFINTDTYTSDEYIIPKNLFMCCKNKNIIPEYVLNNWKLLNPEYKIFIYDDLECIDFFKKYFDIKFLETFIYIKDGPIKSDFWRLCILYYYGGIYSDIDIEPIKPLDVILHKNISFLIVKRNNAYMFNPHFIASVKNNLILKEIIDKYILYYEKQITYSYWKWSILTMSQRILNKYIGYSVQEGFYKYNHGHCKIITENIGLINLIFNRYKAYNSYNNVRLFNTRYLTYHEFSHTY